MRTALVTVVVVLQYAAQLPCRSVSPRLRPKPSSHEDLETIIARNREITELLVPLLEANLEAKRHDQKHDFKVYPYRDGKNRKDPVVELLPLIKHKSKTPLALILASELRSRNTKKGRSKVHAQKAFLVQNDKDSSEVDDDVDVRRNRKKYHTSNGNTVEEDLTKEVLDKDVRSKRKNKPNSDESDENENTVEASELNSSGEDSGHGENVNKLKKNALTKESLEESVDVSNEEVVQKKKKQRKTKLRSNIKVINRNSKDYIETQSSESSRDSYEVENSVDDVSNSMSEVKGETLAPQYLENLSDLYKITLPGSDEDYVETADSSNETKLESEERPQMSDTESVSKELLIIDVSKEHAQDVEQSKYLTDSNEKNRLKENDNSNEYWKSDESTETKEKYKLHSEQDSKESRSSENVDAGNDTVTYENNDDEDADDEQQHFDASDNSEENKTSEDQVENEVENQDDNVTNDSNASEPDQDTSDYSDLSENNENLANESYDEVYDEEEKYDEQKESEEGTSYEDFLDDNVEDYENHSKAESNEINVEYIQNEDSLETKPLVKSLQADDTPTVDDDDYTDEWIDDDGDSLEAREAKNDSTDNQVKDQVTFSNEIADKYADDSKYTVENDHSLVESSGEFGQFNAESVEGLITVLQQDQDSKENKCTGKESYEYKNDKHSHSQEVHKSYKLSFKFNK